MKSIGIRLVAAVMMALTRLGQRLRDLVAAPCPLPGDDPFYRQDDSGTDSPPGTVFAARSIRVRSPWVPRGTRSWQLRYRSTDVDGTPISAVATLLVPARSSGPGPRPLVSYQCAIDSLGSRANPSLGLRRGTQRELPMMRRALCNGWAVVTADYTGPQCAFGVGPLAAHLVLDGIRAALAHLPAGLGSTTPVGLWGYSGGGQASMWAGEQQPTIAPELNLVATAAGGVPVDIRAIQNIDGTFFSGLSLAASVGISRAYPETRLTELLDDAGRRVLDEVADMTVDELVAYFPFRRLAEFSTVPDPFAVEEVTAVADRLRLGQDVPTAPVLLLHAIKDQIVPIGPAEELAENYRAGGAEVNFLALHGCEHLLGVGRSVTPSIRFLRERFAAAADH